MKQIYTLITLLALFSSQAFSQQLLNQNNIKRGIIPAGELQNLRQNHTHSSTAGTVDEFYVDHSAANFDDAGYVWDFNSLYTSVDTSLNYAAIALDTLVGFYDVNDVGTFIDYPFPYSMRIDSIFVYFTHENNSGQFDKIKMSIVSLNGNGFPTNNVLWSQEDSTDVSLSPCDNWLGTGCGVVNYYTPAYETTDFDAVGLVFEYRDPSKSDTLGLGAGFVDDGSGGTTDTSAYATSFMRYVPNIPNITRNVNVGYGSPVGTDGWFEAQNWYIWAYITILDLTAVNDLEKLGMSLSQNRPNPFNGSTTITYELAAQKENIKLEVYDMMGKKVREINEGRKSAGKHDISFENQNLTAGTYYYSLITEDNVLTKKMTIFQ